MNTGNTAEPTLKPSDITDPGLGWALQSPGWVTVEPSRKKKKKKARSAEQRIFGSVFPIKHGYELDTDDRRETAASVNAKAAAAIFMRPGNRLHWENRDAVAEQNPGGFSFFLFLFLVCTGWGNYKWFWRGNLLFLGANLICKMGFYVNVQFGHLKEKAVSCWKKYLLIMSLK